MKLLQVSNLSKSYKSYGSELKRIFNWIYPLFKPVREYEVFKDINLEVKSGEAIGLIGTNGAGKSTLLKIITGTLQPTSGTVNRSGRISAILELGMGFNHNLTGRQNVIHAAGLMGHSLEDIQEALPEIEEFSEVGEFFDQPVRIYSSGMQMRVAFAVATAFSPDILIIDEALSVGDSYFQHKSFNKIKQLQSNGTTLVIVSHDKSAILSLCSRCLLLHKGRVLKDGNPEEIFDVYNALLAEKNESLIKMEPKSDKTAVVSGTGEAIIKSVTLLNSKNISTDVVAVTEKIKLKVDIEVMKDIQFLVLGYLIKDRVGNEVFGSNTALTGDVIKNLSRGEKYSYSVSFNANLGVGSYSLSLALTSSENHLDKNYEWHDSILIFNVANSMLPRFAGIAWLDSKVDICKGV